MQGEGKASTTVTIDIETSNTAVEAMEELVGLITVDVQHEGPGEPTVDVAELLPVALERAKEAPSE